MAKQHELFRLIDHACRVCGGRLLSRGSEDGRQHIRCAECGAHGESAPHADNPHRLVCYCGATLMSGVNARLRCHRNGSITPEQPQEVVVVHAPDELKPVKKPEKSTPRAVALGGFDW